jgi:hypothetical protein
MRGGVQLLIDAREKIGVENIVSLPYHTDWLIEGLLKSEGRKLNEEWGG